MRAGQSYPLRSRREAETSQLCEAPGVLTIPEIPAVDTGQSSSIADRHSSGSTQPHRPGVATRRAEQPTLDNYIAARANFTAVSAVVSRSSSEVVPPAGSVSATRTELLRRAES